MISISSRPNGPFSPTCGLTAATLRLGRRPSMRVKVPSASSTAAVMREGVIISKASRSDTCEVTRKVENAGITFISPKKP